MIMISNAINIVYLYRKKQSTFENLLLSLSIADFLFGFSSFVTKTCHIALNPDDLQLIAKVGYCMVAFSLYSSMLHVCVIALDRFMAVKFPFFHRTNRARKSTRYSIIFSTWVVPIPLCVLKIDSPTPMVGSTTVEQCSMITECIVIALLYVFIIKIAVRSGVADKSSSGATRAMSRQKQLILVMSSFAIFIVFFISMLPSMLCLVSEFCDQSVNWWFILINSLLNPLVYLSVKLIQRLMQWCKRNQQPLVINALQMQGTDARNN